MSRQPAQQVVVPWEPRQVGQRPALALTLIAIAQLMVYLDTTIVNVALPHIQHALGFSGSGLEWVVNAYAVSFGGLLLLGGRAGDRLGRRRVFAVGAFLFAAASLAGGLASDQAWLLVARAVQGVGAAIIAPTTLSLVTTTFPEGPRRTRAMAVYSGATAVGGAFGLIAGGLLVSYLSWRWVLFVNVPIGLGLAIAAPRAFGASERLRGRFDLPGAITGTCGLAALIYGLSNAVGAATGAADWTNAKVLGPLAGAVALLAAFVVIEVRTPDAVLPVHLFRDRNRVGAYLNMLCTGTCMYGIFFFTTLFMQEVWGYSPLKTGAAYLPMIFMTIALAAVIASIVSRAGPRPLLLIGSLITAGGMVWLSRITANGTYVHSLLFPILVVAVGLGIGFVPMNLMAMAKIRETDSGAASSMLNAGEQVGGSLGLAVLGTVAWTVVSNSIRASLGRSGQPGAQIPAPVYDHALVSGLSRALEVSAGVAIFAFFVALFLIRNRTEHE